MNYKILKESAKGIDQIFVEDALLDDREVFLTSEVNAENVSELMKAFMYLEKESPGKEITFYINSPGGSVSDGLALYDYIRLMKSPVTTICIGRAASMGAILFLAGENRKMLPHSEIMIHDASFGNAEFSGLKPDEISEKANDLLKTSKILREIVAERTGQDAKLVAQKMKKDSFFKADEAMQFGLATEIMTKESSNE